MNTPATVQLLKITPELASEWLAQKFDGQRNVRQPHVARIASDMEAGRFHVSPDAILRVNGKLANGQHRLTALIQTGKPQTFLVMECDNEELYKVIDSGVRRTASDALRGHPNAEKLPAIARWIMMYDERCLSPSRDAASTKRISQAAVVDYCLDNQDVLCAAVEFVRPLYSQTGVLNLSIGSAIHVIGSRASLLSGPRGTEAFLESVYVSGGNNIAGDLKNRLTLNRGSKAKLAAGYVFGLTLKAHHAFVNNKRPGVLKWTSGDVIPEL